MPVGVDEAGRPQPPRTVLRTAEQGGPDPRQVSAHRVDVRDLDGEHEAGCTPCTHLRRGEELDGGRASSRFTSSAPIFTTAELSSVNTTAVSKARS